MSQKAPEAEFIVSSPVKKAEAAKLPVSDVTPTGFSTSVSQALPDVVQRIVQALQPKKIILFGSYAYGNPTPDSDVVILNQAPPWLCAITSCATACSCTATTPMSGLSLPRVR